MELRMSSTDALVFDDLRPKSDFETAIFYYTKALEIMPSHFKALFNRGFANDKIGNFDNAIEDYSKAI